jgi:exopolysaccharide production protein ExoY
MRLSRRVFSHRQAFLVGSRSHLQTDHDFRSEASVAPVGLTSKRIVDIVLALSGIILLAPLLIICFVVTWTSSPWPVIFRHKRIGFNGKTFNCLKFRTMVADAPERLRNLLEADAATAAEWAQCHKLRNDPRVTPIGAILRKSSLDELPQLFNVLIGDMSMVGPRPVTEAELSRYGTSVTAYTACRPGITGLWQVTGRSSTSYETRISCDAYYARMWSLSLDSKIIMVTIPSVLFTENAH